MPPKFVRAYGAEARPTQERQALLDGDSDEDDFFLRGPNANASKLLERDNKMTSVIERKRNRKQQIHGQVAEVVGVMHDNIGKVLTRGERLEDLQDKSEDLSSSADMFMNRSKALKNRMWWRECKMKMLFAFVVLAIFAIIFIPIIVKLTKKH